MGKKGERGGSESQPINCFKTNITKVDDQRKGVGQLLVKTAAWAFLMMKSHLFLQKRYMLSIKNGPLKT